jgi:hypothetical protein
MRLMLWFAGAAVGAVSGAAAANFFPPEQAARALGLDLSGFTIADLNPIRAAFDLVKTRVQAGTTPEDLGFHGSPVVVTMPDPKNWPGPSFTLDPSQRNGWAQTAAQQTRAFNNHMEDIRNYAHNPAGWHGVPPH